LADWDSGRHRAKDKEKFMAKLRHVSIKVDDLDAAAKLYCEVFEMKEVGRAGPQDTTGAVYLSDGVVNLALIKLLPQYSNWKPEGLNHIGFVVEDMDAAVARAEAHGAVAMTDNLDQATAEAAGATWEVKMRMPDGVAFDFSVHGWPGNSQLD
jgi:4-hydroxyphenylpyruvate dioxygenase-like putative hemolysin